MKSVDEINRILGDCGGGRNNTGDIYLNVIKNEFIKINGIIDMPKIPVKELDYGTAVPITAEAAKYIPEFLAGHDLLADRKPAAEQHSLQFVKSVKGRVFDFIHMFKLYLRFEGDSRNVIEKGDTGNYPSYRTDRLYYKSRLVPVSAVTRENDKIDFKQMKMITADYVKSDQSLFTSAIFDELDRKELTRDIHKKLSIDVFSISPEIYPFFVYDYFTVCLSVLYPTGAEIEKAVEMFEPVFITVYDKYAGIRKSIHYDDIKNTFQEQLYFVDELFLKVKFLDDLRSYFQRWSLTRDDDLALKGWWKFIVK